jgi:16S rRNA (guanine527-N7)-methyltransferase
MSKGEQFISAVIANQREFGLEVSAKTTERLADYFELIQQDNPLLHLVAPCTPEEFAIRHILESLTMAKFMPTGALFADIGTGAGLPAIPCLLAREDLRATLIESKEKKAAFLSKAAAALDLTSRVKIVNRQFDEVRERGLEFVSCRALDRFVDRLPRLLKWTGRRTFLFFGGPSLGEALTRERVRFESYLLPMSEQRFLFVGPKAKGSLR